MLSPPMGGRLRINRPPRLRSRRTAARLVPSPVDRRAAPLRRRSLEVMVWILIGGLMISGVGVGLDRARVRFAFAVFLLGFIIAAIPLTVWSFATP